MADLLPKPIDHALVEHFHSIKIDKQQFTHKNWLAVGRVTFDVNCRAAVARRTMVNVVAVAGKRRESSAMAGSGTDTLARQLRITANFDSET